MKVLILNGSPKGKKSVTLQTALYLEKRHPEHEFTVIDVGRRIQYYEKNFEEVQKELEQAELIIFAYPVYTFLAPYQLQRFLELLKENGITLKDKYATQITTSKHFYDVTAHRFIEENCLDLQAWYLEGFSADMDDLLTEKGQRQADNYFNKLFFDLSRGAFSARKTEVQSAERKIYPRSIPEGEKTGQKDVLVLTNTAGQNESLQNMIADFAAGCPHPVRIVNLRDFSFAGGCLGCLACASNGKCVYHDGFEDFLRNDILNADAIVYAFEIENHYAHSSFKCYDDRQFCNGHRFAAEGKPVGYIISGNYQKEANLQMVIEARSEVGEVYLCGIATDEGETKEALVHLTESICYVLENPMEKPQNFYGVGGRKIFRDLVYLMRGMMRADHQYYKKHGVYDFPQKQVGKMLQMKAAGALLSIPAVQKKMNGNMDQYILAPYQKIIANAKAENRMGQKDEK
ncbi:MAG: NAD(P)H-dependent oxidoreductase [Christensenella sp.]|nr:NAD(P)H-dependent oxidoreductase [Christensenella sp.]